MLTHSSEQDEHLQLQSDRIPSKLLTRPIAHRGLHCGPEAPENSMAAFALAIAHGYPIELDVRLLADGGLAVFHDVTLDRMTSTSGPIATLTSDKLGDLRLQGTESRIPILQEVLDFVSGRTTLLIELKTNAFRVGDLERAVVSALRRYDGEFAIQSFNPISVAWFRIEAPGFCRGQLSGGEVPAAVIRNLEPDFVAYALSGLPNAEVSKMGSAGLPILAWTIRSEDEQLKAQQVADNFIFEGYPQLKPQA